MVLSLIVMNVKVSLVYPTLLVTAAFSEAPHFRNPTIIWSIQRARAPLLDHLPLRLVLQPIPAQVPIPLPNSENNKIFQPVSPGSSSKYYPLSFFLLPLHFSKEKSVLAASRFSPHIHSLSHSNLASVPTPSLNCPHPITNDPATLFQGSPYLVSAPINIHLLLQTLLIPGFPDDTFSYLSAPPQMPFPTFLATHIRAPLRSTRSFHPFPHFLGFTQAISSVSLVSILTWKSSFLYLQSILPLSGTPKLLSSQVSE